MAEEERFLVTGALGCIGSWTVANLIWQDVAVTTYDLGDDPYRIRYLLDEAQLEKVDFVQGDITDGQALERVVSQKGITHLIHLAALQVPFCRADPVLGARVNVVGTVNVFEAAKKYKEQIGQVVYASSAAVYGPKSDYDISPVPVDAVLRPGTHYGVYKQANEGTALLFWQNDGVSSIGVRPYIVYGVGRDQGMTSGTSKAMLAAAAGRKFHIPHGGRADYQYADDVARTLIACARSSQPGASVHNLSSNGYHVHDVVAAIEAALPAAAGQITYDGETTLPFPDSLDDSSLSTILDEVPAMPLQTAVGQTVERFSALLEAGVLNVDRALT